MSKPSTKQRILETALSLFNLLGTPNISTNHVALELDISPGNLYYYFRSKDQLIECLFDEYALALDPLLNQTIDDHITLEDLWFFLHLNFELLAQFRFIYQDTDYLVQKCPGLKKKIKKILTSLQDSILNLLDHLANEEQIINFSSLTKDPSSTPAQTLEQLSVNMLLICTQWIRFNQHFTGQSPIAISSDDISRGIYQVLSLLLPYLDDAHQDHLVTLIAEYS